MLNGWMALAIPVIASAFLVLMFFFFSSISQIFTLLACAVSGVSVVFAFAPLAEAAWRAAGLSLETDDKAPESATLMEMTRRNPHLKSEMLTLLLSISSPVSGSTEKKQMGKGSTGEVSGKEQDQAREG